MTTQNDRATGQAASVRRGRWALWILVPALVGAAVAAGLAARVPPLYKSETLIAVVPQRVPESFVPSTVSAKLGERLQMISESILNRTRLERLIKEFNLYEEERRKGTVMEDIFEDMRANIDTTVEGAEGASLVAFRVGYVGTNPRTVMLVTERLATLFINENLVDRSTLAENTTVFLDSQLQDVRRRLVTQNKALRAAREKQLPEAETLAIENEVLRATFKDLSAKVEEARMAAKLESQQIGEQFKVIDGARLPERPITPDWRKYLGIGASSGAALGVLLFFGAPSRSARSRRKGEMPGAPADDDPSSDPPLASN